MSESVNLGEILSWRPDRKLHCLKQTVVELLWIYLLMYISGTQKMVGKHQKTLTTKIGQEHLFYQRRQQLWTPPDWCELLFLLFGCAHSEETLKE